MIAIWYSLSLPGKILPAEAKKLVQRLRVRCLDLPFEDVDPTIWLALKPVGVGFSCRMGNLKGSVDFKIRLDLLAGRWFFEGMAATGWRMQEAFFLARHQAVVSALDYAQELGVGVTVRDDSEFWNKRSKQDLLVYKRVMDVLPDPREFMCNGTSDNIAVGERRQKL